MVLGYSQFNGSVGKLTLGWCLVQGHTEPQLETAMPMCKSRVRLIVGLGCYPGGFQNNILTHHLESSCHWFWEPLAVPECLQTVAIDTSRRQHSKQAMFSPYRRTVCFLEADNMHASSKGEHTKRRKALGFQNQTLRLV